MTTAKYAPMVKQLAFKKGSGGANAREMVFVTGEEMGGFDLNFIVGIYDQTGDWAPGRGAHVHPFDECLLFFGHNPEDLGYLGADLEISLGKEGEKHKLSLPTVVVAAKGVPHCPLVTQKVYQPFGHFHLALSAKYASERVAQEGQTDGHKYAHLVKPFAVKKGTRGAKQLVSFSGDQLEGLNLNFTMGLYDRTGEWEPGGGAHVHPYDECMVFFGHDTGDIGYLGAELTVEMGKEHEKHTFDRPTLISVPAGTPHFPIICNKVEKPYSMVQVGLGARYQSSPSG